MRRRWLIMVSSGVLILAAGWFLWPRIGPPAPRPENLAQLDPLVAQVIAQAADAADRDRRNADARLRLGMIYEANDLTALAIETYRQLVDRDPAHARAWYRLGLAHTRRGETDAALDAFARVTELEPSYAAAHWRLGYRALDAGDANTAQRAFERAIMLQPDDLAPRFGRALAALQQRRAEDAIELIRSGLLTTPERGYAQHLHAMALRQAGRPEEADAISGNLRTEPPVWTDPWQEEAGQYRTGYANLRKYAEWLVSNGRFKEAIALLERLERETGADAALLNMLGVARVATGSVEPGLRTLRRGVALDPAYAPIRLNLARARLRTAGSNRRQLETALEETRRAIDLDPTSGEAHELEASILHALGRREEALDRYKDAFELDSRQPTAMLAAGVLELEMERWPDAADTFARVLEHAPDRGEAIIGRAYALLRLGRAADVLRLLEGSSALRAPSDPVMQPYRQALLAWSSEADDAVGARQP